MVVSDVLEVSVFLGEHKICGGIFDLFILSISLAVLVLMFFGLPIFLKFHDTLKQYCWY